MGMIGRKSRIVLTISAPLTVCDFMCSNSSGVGQVQIIRGERLLPGTAIQMQDAESLPRSPQQHAQHGGHRSLGDALGQRQLGVFLDAMTEDRFALREAALSEALVEAKAPGD